MKEYYFLAEKVKPGTAFAYTNGGTPMSHELIPAVKDKADLPFTLFLKKVIPGKNGLLVSDDLIGLKYLWLDYQPNNLAWPLMSEKMKDIVNTHLTGKEGIVWIKAKIIGGDVIREYFIPRFLLRLDVLDEQKTLFVPGTSHVIKPVFSLSKVNNYNLFHKSQEYFWEITSGLYVSENLKNEMQKAKLTGIDFEKTTAL